MKRLEDGTGNSPLISIRLPIKTKESLDELIAALPSSVGPLPRGIVLRAVIDAGIETLANRQGLKLGTSPKPNEGKARTSKPPRASKMQSRAAKEIAPAKQTAPVVHRASRARAERRAAARAAAGCTCGRNHVATCKLYPHPRASDQGEST